MWAPRKPPRKRRDNDPAHIPAAILMMSKEREDRPFGSTGEFLRPQPADPPRPAPQPFVIPPWPESERRKAAMEADPEPPPKPVGDALAVMKNRNGDDWPKMELGPPETVAPLLPVAIPEPDWRAEEREQALRDGEPVDEPAKSLQRRPA